MNTTEQKITELDTEIMLLLNIKEKYSKYLKKDLFNEFLTEKLTKLMSLKNNQ